MISLVGLLARAGWSILSSERNHAKHGAGACSCYPIGRPESIASGQSSRLAAPAGAHRQRCGPHRRLGGISPGGSHDLQGRVERGDQGRRRGCRHRLEAFWAGRPLPGLAAGAPARCRRRSRLPPHAALRRGWRRPASECARGCARTAAGPTAQGSGGAYGYAHAGAADTATTNASAADSTTINASAANTRTTPPAHGDAGAANASAAATDTCTAPAYGDVRAACTPCTPCLRRPDAAGTGALQRHQCRARQRGTLTAGPGPSAPGLG